MKRYLLISLLLAFAIGILSGCGGTSIQISVTPGEVTLAPGGTQTFTAEVVNADITDVTWSVSTGGGAITQEGDYTAPVTPGTYYVRATSVADTNKYGQAKVIVSSGGTGTRVYNGTITIDNAGTQDELTMDQYATMTVHLVFQNCPDLTVEQYGDSDITRPASVSATVNDMQTGSGVTITGSLSSVSMNSPNMVVLLQIKESTYDLLLGGVPITCVFAGSGFSTSQLYQVPGRQITGQSLPANQSHLTGSIELPMEGSPGITQKITWDLQANF